jgi:hypothetical protein
MNLLFPLKPSIEYTNVYEIAERKLQEQVVFSIVEVTSLWEKR